MRILGIDPGKSGAFVAITADRASDPDMTLQWAPMPVIGKPGSKTAKMLDLHSLSRLLEEWMEEAPFDAAYMEQVWARPHDRPHTAFDFGMSYGAVLAALAAHRIPMRGVTPQVWKKYFRIPAGSDKDASRLRASECLPRWGHLWQRKQDDGVAEAALIALFGFNTMPVSAS